MGRALRALILVGLAVTFFVLAMFLVGEAEAQDEPPCYWLDLESVTEDSIPVTREALVSQGWYPIPGDNRKAIYSPPCRVLEERETRALRE